jgi:hypothetical protein
LFSLLRHYRCFAFALLAHGPPASTFLPPFAMRGFANPALPWLLARNLIGSCATCATVKALTAAPVHFERSSPRLPRPTFPSLRLQPRRAPRYRFAPLQRIGLLPGFAMGSQARRYTTPNRVRYPTHRQFASGCSPPRFAATQLPSASELWHTPARTCTVLIERHHGRTVPAFAGMALDVTCPPAR